MGRPQDKPATYQDIMGLPEHLVGEIINGRLVTHPRPATRHARSYSSLGMQIGNPDDFCRGGPGGWWILDEPELHLGGHVLVPDLAGWRRERMPALPQTSWFEQAPDRVCEILPRGTARVDRAEKLPICAGWGWSTPGWWTPICACWRPIGVKRDAGCCWALGRRTPRPPSPPSMPSARSWPCSGRDGRWATLLILTSIRVATDEHGVGRTSVRRCGCRVEARPGPGAARTTRLQYSHPWSIRNTFRSSCSNSRRSPTLSRAAPSRTKASSARLPRVLTLAERTLIPCRSSTCATS